MTITGNQLLRNAGFGIDFITGINAGNTIRNNVFSGNGTGGTDQSSGIGLRGAGSNRNTISNNTFTNNNGGGIIAKTGTTGNIFSQNSFSGNGTTSAAGLGLAIDLTSAATTTNNGDGVTLNDAGDTDGYDTTKNPATTTGGNALLNFPVLQTAVLAGGVLTLKGYARPNVVVELYLAAPDPTYFGEGQTYLTSFTQAAAAGTTGNVVTDAATTYSGTQPDNLNQGTDTTTPFTFTYTPTAAQLTQLQATTGQLTATATLTTADAVGNFGTSEFSGLVRVLQNPVPDNATNATVAPNTASPVALSPSLSATASGYASDVTTTTANTIGSYTVGPATNGTLYYNGAAVTAATIVTDATQLTFLPAAGFTGNATFPYTATDANGQASTRNKTGSTTAAGAATYTIPVAAPLPVVLVRFEAVPSLATAVLTWQTASEVNNQYFAIERSPDGAAFKAIGQVAGHNSVATAQQYRFVDAGAGSLGQPLVYYRLRQVNYDGTSSYSPVQVVRFAADGPTPATFTIAPNPVEGTLHAQLPTAGAHCLVYNLMGQLLQRAYTATQQVAIALPNLPAGTYVLVVQPEQGTPLQQRFSKQ
ncbi:MAG: T9SS type A sorting domain-containing protein [Cytophagaceae bacterium]|nr:MAG: T9SS type A sorting domain-containing protein [Cytophagaceae bacterium]